MKVEHFLKHFIGRILYTSSDPANFCFAKRAFQPITTPFLEKENLKIIFFRERLKNLGILFLHDKLDNSTLLPYQLNLEAAAWFVAQIHCPRRCSEDLDIVCSRCHRESPKVKMKF